MHDQTSLVARVVARKAELEGLLDALPEDDVGAQGDLYLALATINDLLTGDLENVPAVVVADMSRWLERHEHLRAAEDQRVVGGSSTALASPS